MQSCSLVLLRVETMYYPQPTFLCLTIQDKSHKGEKWVSFFTIFGLVIQKPNKTGIMNVVHISTLCRMHHCCIGSVLPLLPLILTHGSRWSSSACAS